MIIFLVAMAAASSEPPPGRYEGDWYVSDTTDNVTGEREVEAFQMQFKGDESSFVTIKMRCLSGKPTISVEWDNLSFPDQTVLSISPILSDGTNPKSERYIFEKPSDDIFRGLRASPDASANIVTTIGDAKQINLVAHLSTGSKGVEIDVNGTRGAWGRVSRNCPIRIMPLPAQ
jgi:hypothetical protein